MAIIFETQNFIVEAHPQPHVTRTDGGHIRISPKVKIKNRTELEPAQAIEFIRLTMLVGEAMEKSLKRRGVDIQRINYQDNGNWTPYFHVHLYGRAKDAKIQPYGHALNFPLRDTGFYKNNEPLNDGDIDEIRTEINRLSKTVKYSLAKWH